MRIRRILTVLLATATLVGALAFPAGAHNANDEDFVDFVAQQAEKSRGSFNIVGQVVLALAEAGVLTSDDLNALTSAEITAFLPTDLAFRRLAADIADKRVWRVTESEVIGISPMPSTQHDRCGGQVPHLRRRSGRLPDRSAPRRQSQEWDRCLHHHVQRR